MIGKKRAESAYTLAELLVGLAIFTLSLIFIYAIYFSGQELWELERDKLDIQASARTAIARMGTELQRATRASTASPSPNITIPAAPGNTRITFYLPKDLNGDGYPTGADGLPEWDMANPVEFRYLNGSREIVRIQGGSRIIIARDVESAEFRDAGIDGSLFLNEIKIVMTLKRVTTRSRDVTFTLSSNVRLRN